MEMEAKIKNSGEASYEIESNCLQTIEGLEEAQIIFKGDVNAKRENKDYVGFEFDKKDVVKSKHFMQISKDPTFSSEIAYRMCPCMTVAEKTEFKVNKPADTMKSQLALAGHLEKQV